MQLLPQLAKNKGALSNALSKKIAKEILKGKPNLLKDAVPLVLHNPDNKKEKHIRIGAACIVDEVAKEQPKMVTPYLERLFPALEVDEPQTRWIVLRVLGNCAEIKPEMAKKAIIYAKKYILEKAEGQLCLVSSADMFLGEYGKRSKEAANEVFPVLMESMKNVIRNEHDWIMEACMKLSSYLNKAQKEVVVEFSKEYADHPRKATRSRVEKIISCCSSQTQQRY